MHKQMHKKEATHSNDQMRKKKEMEKKQTAMRNNEQRLNKKEMQKREKHSNEQMQIKGHAALHKQMQRKKAMHNNEQMLDKKEKEKQCTSRCRGRRRCTTTSRY